MICYVIRNHKGPECYILRKGNVIISDVVQKMFRVTFPTFFFILSYKYKCLMGWFLIFLPGVILTVFVVP